jgi:hypothetical protein
MELTLKVYPNIFKIDSITNLLGIEAIRELKLERLFTKNNIRNHKLIELLDQTISSIKPDGTVLGRLYDDLNSQYEIELSKVSHVVSKVNYYFDLDTENVKIESIEIKTISTPDGKLLDGLIMAGYEFELIPVKVVTSSGYERVFAFDIKVPSIKNAA